MHVQSQHVLGSNRIQFHTILKCCPDKILGFKDRTCSRIGGGLDTLVLVVETDGLVQNPGSPEGSASM